MKQDSYVIDNRNITDIEDMLVNLAKSYTPEWNFDISNPDIGAVLAILFAGQLQGNVTRFNQILEQYHTEFVNLLDISLRPAHPACATVLMDLIADTVSDVFVKKGTRLQAGRDDRVIAFETAFPVALSASKLKLAFMTSGQEGKILPVFGSFTLKDYLGEEQSEYVLGETMRPFSLFDFKENGIERQAMVFYHSRIFDVENEPIYCRVEGNTSLFDKIQSGEVRFLYYTEEGFLPVESWKILGDEIMLIKQKKNKKVKKDEKSYSVIAVEATKPQTVNQTISSISFSSSGGICNAEFVGNGSTDYDVTEFPVFGDTLSLYSECYIGMDRYFSQQGAKITLDFQVNYKEHYVGYSVEEEERPDLRIVKRKPRFKTESRIAYANAEEISIEYFNGLGWKRLECDREYRGMFAEGAEGNCKLSFLCPKDWRQVQIGGYYGRMLRIQLQRSDNCYLQPCIHRYPVVTKLTCAYTYVDRHEYPERAEVLFGTTERDITDKIIENKGFLGFEHSNYSDTALYLGFDKVFETGPVSLWWRLADRERNTIGKVRFYYSTAAGFKEMKIVDYTQNLTQTGIILFLPPADMGMMELEGKRLCWLKIVKTGGEESEIHTIIEDIRLNAVEVNNTMTYEPEEFYIEEVQAGMSFPLRSDGILDAEVWVNERLEMSDEMIRRMMEEQPELVKVTQDYRGDITEFFVKWEEKDNFLSSGPLDRHYVLDRMNNRILFGDGVRVKIPQCTTGVAFTAGVRCCNGAMGNVEAGMINSSENYLMYVERIYNPLPAYGGCNMETLEQALARGADLISGGGRFVTEQDYRNEIINYSENINKSALVSGVDKYGNENDRMLYVVLLMKDFRNGSSSFYRMQGELKRSLLDNCEMTILPSELSVEEPVFVELNVDVWVQIINIEDSFEVQNLLRETLEDYLNPITDATHKGWEIGVVPRKTQILMKLNSLKSEAIIRHIVITAQYKDSNGTRVVDLEDLKVSPFMVVCSGTHKIHTVQAENN